jgi:hypothetical protein
MLNISNSLKDPFAKQSTQNASSASSLVSSFGVSQNKTPVSMSIPNKMSVNKATSATPSAIIPPTIAAPATNIVKAPVTVSQLSTSTPTPPVQQDSKSSTMSFVTSPTITEAPTSQVAGREDILKRILDITDAQGNQANRQAELEKEFALQAKQDKLNEINARALTVDREYENKKRSIMENPEGKLTGALAGELRNIERERDQRLADIGIQQAVAQGDVNLVTSRIESKIKAEFEPMKQRVEGLKSYLSLYNDDLSSSEKIELESAIRMQENDYETQVNMAKASQSAGAWQQLLDSGQVTIKDIPQAVVPYMNTSTVKKYTDEQVTPIRQKLDLLDGLISGVEGSGAVGPNPLARTSLTSWVTGARQNFVAGVKQLTSQETLNALLELKRAGGALGALSDGERFTLQEAATKIGGWEIKENGIGTGFYNAKETDFKKELSKLQELAEKAMLRADIVPLEEKAKIIGRKIQRDNPTWSEDAKREALKIQLQQYSNKQSFNSAGNASASNVQIPKSSRLAFVNNNPGNLRFVGQKNAVKGEGGFARFNSPQEGLIALQNQIKLDASRGLTLAQFINKFAPPTENDTRTYIQQVQKMTGATPDTPISNIDLLTLTKAVAKKESSTNIT